MPRKARIDAPGALHHIVIRGIERKPIFKDSQDYQNFIERLSDILSEFSAPGKRKGRLLNIKSSKASFNIEEATLRLFI